MFSANNDCGAIVLPQDHEDVLEGIAAYRLLNGCRDLAERCPGFFFRESEMRISIPLPTPAMMPMRIAKPKRPLIQFEMSNEYADLCYAFGRLRFRQLSESPLNLITDNS